MKEVRGQTVDPKNFRVVRGGHDAAQKAQQLGLRVKAGHGLNYRNIKRFHGRPEFSEYSIGHSIIARAVLVGIEQAVRDMLALIKS